MAQPLTFNLSPQQRRELEHTRDHHPKAYMRERAAALLKIADGLSGRQVALSGLLKRRNPDTVYAWVRRYRQEGLAGLQVRAGRGRKPAFSPTPPQRRGGAGGSVSSARRSAPRPRARVQPLDTWSVGDASGGMVRADTGGIMASAGTAGSALQTGTGADEQS